MNVVFTHFDIDSVTKPQIIFEAKYSIKLQ